MTEAEFRSLYERLRSSRRWGPDDRRGALNHLTPAESLAAVREVVLGRSVSLAAPIEGRRTADNPDPARHRVQQAPAAGHGVAFSVDRIEMNIHGNADSHIDALCHVIFDGEEYNGVPEGAGGDTGRGRLSIATAGI